MDLASVACLANPVNVHWCAPWHVGKLVVSSYNCKSS